MPKLKFPRTAFPAVLIAGGLAAWSYDAQADFYTAKNVSLAPQSSNLGDIPAVVFTPKNGQWVFEEKGASTVRLRLKARRGALPFRIHGYRVHAQIGSGTRVNLHQTGAAALHLKRLDKTLQKQLTWQDLKPLAGKLQKVCQTHGDPAKKVVKSADLTLVAILALGHKNYSGGPGGVWNDTSQLQQTPYTSGHIKDIKTLPVRVVCRAAPFEVKSAEVTVSYKGNPQSCPVEARLKVKLKANKAGKTEFLLTRDNGMNQKVTVNVGADGIGTWQKKYNLNQPTQRKYLVTVLGHKVSTPWKTMSACLFNSGGGGLTTGARPQRN